MAALRNVNLNMLPVLHALLLHRNITRAGDDLKMSQSAVSDALAKLRHTFKDELLVRNGRQMELTSFAQSLVPQLQLTISSMENLLGVPEFDPTHLAREFVIASADTAAIVVGPPMIAAMRELTPQSSLHFVSLNDANMRDASMGTVDIAIGPQEIVPEGFRHAELYQDKFVCIMRKNHPLAKMRLTLEDYLSAPHASFRPERHSETVESKIIRKAGVTQFDAVRVPQFSLLPYFVATSDCIALIAEGLALRLQAGHGFVIKDLPFEDPPITMSQWWSEVRHHNVEHRWFREILSSVSTCASYG